MNLIDSESNQPSEPAAKTRCKVNKITKSTSLDVLEGWEPKQDVKLTSIKWCFQGWEPKQDAKLTSIKWCFHAPEFFWDSAISCNDLTWKLCCKQKKGFTLCLKEWLPLHKQGCHNQVTAHPRSSTCRKCDHIPVWTTKQTKSMFITCNSYIHKPVIWNRNQHGAGLISYSIVNPLNMTKQRALCIPHAELANHAERKKRLLPLDQASMPGSQVLWRVARSLLVLGSESENSSQNKKEHINHHGRTIQIIICQTHPWWVQPSLCFKCKGWKLLGPSDWVIALYLSTHFFLTVCTLSSYQDLIISTKQLGLTDWVASA